MSSSLTRDFAADFEIRNDGTGRTVHGIIVPFGISARVSDGGAPYDEQFQRGAFAKTLSEMRAPVRLLEQHNTSNVLGVGTELREDGAGFYGAFKVSNTTRGNDALELVRDGAYQAFSVGFRPISHVQRGGVTVRTEVALREVSLVTFPAYEGALVSGVRSLDPTNAALAQQLLTVLAVADAQLDPIVDALCAADGALDAAQEWVAAVLGVPSPECCDCCEGDCACGDCSACGVLADPVAGPAAAQDMAAMGPILENASPLISLARRLDAAITARTSATSPEAGTDRPQMHLGRNVTAWNNFLAAISERNIRA